jgi:hypothetical protein
MKRSIQFAGLAASVLAVSTATLGAQTVTYNPGTTFDSPTLTGFQTLGANMTGMQVTVDFALSGVVSGAWGDLGGGACGVNFGGFTLTLGCDTDSFGNTWSLNNATNDRVNRVRFNGAPGRTLFDIAFASSTPGSELGFTLQNAGGTYAGNVFGNYANLVGVGGAPPVGDLYEQLTISFDDALGAGATYDFFADTDNSDFDSPPPRTVPEPAAFALMGIGLLGLATTARRRGHA